MIKYSKFLAGALLLLALTACGEEEKTKEAVNKQGAQIEQHENHDHEGQNEHEQFTRLIVSSDTGIHVLNEKFEEVQKIALANTSISQISNSPFIFTKNKERNTDYQFMHAGVWIENHGDHDHPYKEDAKIHKTKNTGNKPAHVVSNDNQVAVFNDGDGSVQVYSLDGQKRDEEPTLKYTYKGFAHHGVAIPLENNELAVSYPKNEDDVLPTGVKIVNEKGEEQAIITDACIDLHGAAYTNTGLAFGCVGSVTLYDLATKKTKEIPLKDEGSRVGTFKFAKDSKYLLANYSIGKEASKEVGIINTGSGEINYVTLPAAYKSALFATKDKGYVIAEDGYLYEIDLATATITTKIHAFNPINLNEESPIIFEMNGTIFVSMPSYEKIYAVHGDHTHEVAKLDYVPTAIIVK